MKANYHLASVVIPVWNEEPMLPRLLHRLRLHLPLIEIVVADHDSEDRSREIARQFNCKVVRGGRPGTARNAGAAAASGAILLFVDADVVLGAWEIDQMLSHFSNERIIGVHPRLRPLTSDRYVLFCYGIVDFYFWFVQNFGFSQGLGSIVAVRKSAFEKLGGFSETLAVGEDADFFRRLGRIGHVVYDRSISIFVSARRFSLENRVGFAFKCCVWALLRLLGSSRSPWGYRWARYPSHVIQQETLFLSQAKRLLSGEP